MLTIRKDSLCRPGDAPIRFTKSVLLFLIALMFAPPLPAGAADKRLVILPLALYADPGKAYLRQGLRTMFISRLSGEGVEIIAEQALDPLLSDQDRKGVTSVERAGQLARQLRADYAVFGAMTAMGQGYSLDLSILEFKDGKPKVTNVSEPADEDRFIPKVSEVVDQFKGVMAGVDIEAQRMARYRVMADQDAEGGKGLFFKPTAEARSLQPAGRISLRAEVMSLDTGDLEGNGEAKLVVLIRDKLMIYQRLGQKAGLKDTFKASRGEDFLKVSVGDMDRNGRAEIYLVSAYGQRARTRVLEWTGKFRTVLTQTGHLQFIKDPGGTRPLLLFQDSKIDKFFTGPIYGMNYISGGLSKGEALHGLKDAQFYSLALFDFNRNGIPEFIGLVEGAVLGEEGPIQIWDTGGNVVWRGNTNLGGTNNAIRIGERQGPGELRPRVAFNSRIAVADIDGDGEKEILAVQNIPFIEASLDLRVFMESKLVAYKMEGPKLVRSWSTRKLKYCLTEIQAEGDTIYVAASKAKFSNLGQGIGRVMWFE